MPHCLIYRNWLNAYNWAQFMKKLSNRPTLADCLFFLGIVFISTLPYILGLGFYTDDWSYRTLEHFTRDGIGTMIREMMRSDSDLAVRPVQLAYLVLSFEVTQWPSVS